MIKSMLYKSMRGDRPPCGLGMIIIIICSHNRVVGGEDIDSRAKLVVLNSPTKGV